MIDRTYILPRSLANFLFLGIVGIILLFLFGELERSITSYVLPWISFTFFTLYCIKLSKIQPMLFVAIFYIIFSQWGAILSGALIETNSIFIIEQNRYSFASGSTYKLVIYNLICINIASYFFYVLYNKNKIISDIKEMSVIAILSVVTIAYVFLIYGLVVYGSPFFMQMDRFAYWYNIAPSIIKLFFGYCEVTGFLCGIVRSSNVPGIYRKMAIVYLLIAIIIEVLYAEKFTGIVMLIYLFYLPVIVRKIAVGQKINIRLLIENSFKLLGIILFVTGLIVYHYSSFYEKDILEALLFRFSLQGHVWWGINEISLNQPWGNLNHFITEVSNFFVLNPDTDEVGMTFLMFQVAPSQMVDSFIQFGINFTMGYPAIGLYTFGYLGLCIIQILVGVIFAIYANYMICKIKRSQWMHLFITIKIFTYINSAFTMGRLYDFFSLKMITCLVILCLLEYFYSLKARGNQN